MKLYKYTDTEIIKLLQTMKIVCDTREKSNKHILDYLDNKKIEYQSEKLDHGDYTVIIPANEEMGLIRPLCFHNIISIERKSGLNELSQNLAQNRTQFENEMLRAKGKVILLIEDNSYEDIINHNYNTKYKPLSFIASLKTFENRYNIQTNFIKKAYAGNYIYFTLYYAVREYLKNSSMSQVI